MRSREDLSGRIMVGGYLSAVIFTPSVVYSYAAEWSTLARDALVVGEAASLGAIVGGMILSAIEVRKY